MKQGLNVIKGASNVINAKDLLGRCKIFIKELTDVSC